MTSRPTSTNRLTNWVPKNYGGSNSTCCGTVQNRMTALRFFFKKVLKRHDPEFDDMGLTRRPKKLPVVLSPEEVEKLIEAAPNIRYRMILVLLYSPASGEPKRRS